MNRFVLRVATPAVSVRSFDHPPGDVHHDPDHEVATSDAISFVEEGSFDVRTAEGSWKLTPGSLFVVTRGLPFSCRHDCETPNDRCLSVSYTDEAVEDLLRADLPPLRPPFARLSGSLGYLRHRILSCKEGEEMRTEILAGALFEALSKVPGSRRGRIEGDPTPLMRRIDRAIDRMEADFGSPLALAELAQTAGLSPFHFARVFRELTGLPPHRYLTAVRLRHAVRMLQQGASVTYTCFEVGFGSLSHFITAFRKRFGVLPSEVQRGARCPALRSALASPVWGKSSVQSA